MPIESCMWARGVLLHIAVEVADQTYHHSFAFMQSRLLEIEQWRGFCYTYGHSGKKDKPQVLSVALSCSALNCNRGLVHYSAMLLQVGKQSKHCRACDICTEGFDHHCWVCVEVPRAKPRETMYTGGKEWEGWEGREARWVLQEPLGLHIFLLLVILISISILCLCS